jgi:hypothetical protein
MCPKTHFYGPESSESGIVGDLGDLGEDPRPVLTRHSPSSHSYPPNLQLLTHITHTHPEIKSNAILELKGRLAN